MKQSEVESDALIAFETVLKFVANSLRKDEIIDISDVSDVDAFFKLQSKLDVEVFFSKGFIFFKLFLKKYYYL